MKKLFLFFILLSGLVFGQKQLYKTLTYNDLITFYNGKLNVKSESLTENIERCKYIISTAKKENDETTLSVFSMLLKGLINANQSDKDNPYVSIYTDASSYNFYDDKNQFVGRIYKEKFEENLEIKGNSAETLLESYYYLLQD
ncbi:hypothetical protein [Chryseobacterium oncorhynchi]|uniref:Uncharacterized protein n=1 Tax=Chryseobacterium oncorhynchi TaxID=741074 RepID=A0A316WLL4_9FLAO|nr:hypothetical protein [Chryseobacterium oncorhynchi]PWN62294.1 hypothetical protein C1638_017530 [Chryseobacterium oncorhynchi]